MSVRIPLPAGELRGLALIGIGVAFFATSSVLIRLAFPISAMEVTFGRLFVGALLVTAIASMRRELRGWFGDARAYWLYGLTMSLHFLFFTGALALTSIAHALSLVYLAPAFIAVLSRLRLGETLSRLQIVGIGLSIVGIALLTGFEPENSARTLLGDFVAVLSAVMFALYSVIGRVRRQSTPLFAYTSRVYVWATIWALPFAAVTFNPAGYTWGRVGALALAGLLPIGIGHTLYNAAVRYVSATKTNLVATQEVTGGVLLGALVLGEIPSPFTLTGAAINLAGVLIVVLGGRSTRQS